MIISYAPPYCGNMQELTWALSNKSGDIEVRLDGENKKIELYVFDNKKNSSVILTGPVYWKSFKRFETSSLRKWSLPGKYGWPRPYHKWYYGGESRTHFKAVIQRDGSLLWNGAHLLRAGLLK